MAYTKTTWVDNNTPAINASNLNKMEQGIFDATEVVGSFTPTVYSDSGTITSHIASGIFTKIGRLVTVHITVSITDAGTGVGSLNVGALPYTALTGRNYIGYGRVDVTTGKMCQGSLLSGGNSVAIKDYSNATVIATNAIISFTVTYVA